MDKPDHIDPLQKKKKQVFQWFLKQRVGSNNYFVMAVKGQTIVDFLYAPGSCLEYLGGVPEVLAPDNLKAAIVKASSYEPDINRAMEDLANHYGTTVVPARARRPKDKALVENGVKLVYTRVYAKLRNLTFFDLPSLNKAVKEKTREHNQTRMQQIPYCKSFLASALGHQVCAQGYKGTYHNMQKLLLKKKISRIEGTISRLFDILSKTVLPILDVFGLANQ